MFHFSSLIDESEEMKKTNGDDEDQTQPQLPSDEDMEDILEHIDEDVEIPDDDEEDLEDTDMLPLLKEKTEPEDSSDTPINVDVTTTPTNGHDREMNSSLTAGPLPKLPPLPPLPPPLLNLEFLKVLTLHNQNNT